MSFGSDRSLPHCGGFVKQNEGSPTFQRATYRQVAGRSCPGWHLLGTAYAVLVDPGNTALLALAFTPEKGVPQYSTPACHLATPPPLAYSIPQSYDELVP